MHPIRLRGPWHQQILSWAACPVALTTLPEPTTVQFPQPWQDSLGASFRGTVAYSRSFNTPTGILPSTPIKVSFQSTPARTIVWLNDELLGITDPTLPTTRFDVTGLIRLRNLLKLRIDWFDPLPEVVELGSLVGEVSLEIG